VKLVEQFRGTHVAAFDIAADKTGDVITDHIAAFIPDEVREPLLEKLAAGYNQAV
jgi:hypothetical protein